MSLSLPPKTVEALHRAFLASFPSEGELRLWVQFSLNESLNVIKKSPDLPSIVLDLFYWIEAGQIWESALDKGVETEQRPLLRDECRKALSVFLTPPQRLPVGAAAKDLVIWDGDPFVDRQSFWIAIDELMTSDRKRVALVNGPPRSGKSYCGGLLDHLSRRKWPHARIALVDLKEEPAPDIKPVVLCRRLLFKLRIEGAGALPPPLPEQDPKGWARDLSAWMAGLIPRAGDPVWVLLDGFDRPGVAEETHVFIASLAAGAAEQGFRLVLLDYDRPLGDRTEKAARRTRLDYISASEVFDYLSMLDAQYGASAQPGWAAAQEFGQQYSRHAPGSATQVDALEHLFPQIIRDLLRPSNSINQPGEACHA
jgi:hypothetical protein